MTILSFLTGSRGSSNVQTPEKYLNELIRAERSNELSFREWTKAFETVDHQITAWILANSQEPELMELWNQISSAFSDLHSWEQSYVDSLSNHRATLKLILDLQSEMQATLHNHQIITKQFNKLNAKRKLSASPSSHGRQQPQSIEQTLRYEDARRELESCESSLRNQTQSLVDLKSNTFKISLRSKFSGLLELADNFKIRSQFAIDLIDRLSPPPKNNNNFALRSSAAPSDQSPAVTGQLTLSTSQNIQPATTLTLAIILAHMQSLHSSNPGVRRPGSRLSRSPVFITPTTCSISDHRHWRNSSNRRPYTSPQPLTGGLNLAQQPTATKVPEVPINEKREARQAKLIGPEAGNGPSNAPGPRAETQTYKLNKLSTFEPSHTSSNRPRSATVTNKKSKNPAVELTNTTNKNKLQKRPMSCPPITPDKILITNSPRFDPNPNFKKLHNRSMFSTLNNQETFNTSNQSTSTFSSSYPKPNLSTHFNLNNKHLNTLIENPNSTDQLKNTSSLKKPIPNPNNCSSSSLSSLTPPSNFKKTINIKNSNKKILSLKTQYDHQSNPTSIQNKLKEPDRNDFWPTIFDRNLNVDDHHDGNKRCSENNGDSFLNDLINQNDQNDINISSQSSVVEAFNCSID